jgi:hypothetical protein
LPFFHGDDLIGWNVIARLGEENGALPALWFDAATKPDKQEAKKDKQANDCRPQPNGGTPIDPVVASFVSTAPTAPVDFTATVLI